MHFDVRREIERRAARRELSSLFFYGSRGWRRCCWLAGFIGGVASTKLHIIVGQWRRKDLGGNFNKTNVAHLARTMVGLRLLREGDGGRSKEKSRSVARR